MARLEDKIAKIKDAATWPNGFKHADDSRETLPLDALVVVRRMGESIYPAQILEH